MDLLNINTSLVILETILPLLSAETIEGSIREAYTYKSLKYYCRSSHNATLNIYYANNINFTNAHIVPVALSAETPVFSAAATKNLLSKYIKCEIVNGPISQTYLDAFVWLSM